MNKDLLSNNFTENIDSLKLRQYVNLIKTILSLAIVYCFLESLAGYSYLKEKIPANPDYTILYSYRISPVIGISILIMSVLSWVYYVKANKLIYISVENNDAVKFNEGYKNFYKSGLITITAFLISITDILIRHILTK